MHLKSNLLLTLILLLGPMLSRAQELTKEQALNDIDQLQSNFKRYHAGLYRFTQKNSIDLAFNQVKDRLEDGSKIDFYTEVTWLLNKVKCGHTRGSLPQRTNNDFKKSQLFLPMSVKYLGDRLFVNEPYTNEGNLKKAEELLSINGRSIQEITDMIFEHHSSDGFIDSGKYRQTERSFSYYYQLYVDRDADRYRLKVRDIEGKERSVSVTGEDWETVQKMVQPSSRRPLLNLEFKEDHAIMKIWTFGSGTISRAGEDYYSFLEESFAELTERKTKNLILDLRGNGGGDDNYGATLVSYFADEPFRYFDRIEVTDAYSGYGNVLKSGKRNLMTSHKGLSVWKPQTNRFKGSTYVLTDGWSFSTCADVATVLHHHGWATFIGEETGGGYDGNTSGNSRSLTLANSGIRVNLPMWMYTTANVGHEHYGRGVRPEYAVYQSRQDLINGKDKVMVKALDVMRSK